jgi:hypothetical protein
MTRIALCAALAVISIGCGSAPASDAASTDEDSTRRHRSHDAGAGAPDAATAIDAADAAIATSVFPPGPVALSFATWMDAVGTGHSLHVTCTLSGTSPDAVQAQCSLLVDNSPGYGFSGSAPVTANGVGIHYRQLVENWRGYNQYDEGGISLGFLRKGDTVWAQLGAYWSFPQGTQQVTYSGFPGLLTVVAGTAQPDVLTTTDSEPCSVVCGRAGERCLSASGETTRWSLETEACTDGPANEFATCETAYQATSGFTGQICRFKLTCKCV